mmetsp:Transcript_63214/g.102419  ORF Transcript_63214/g.102419 Transcript_63214/m.102419 type:complete len:218 (+) Transcript_63214:685-1338(+)
MTSSAPSCFKKSILLVPSGIGLVLPVVATKAPRPLASWMASAPVAAAPPSTSSFCPACSFPSSSPPRLRPAPVNRAWYVVSPTSGRPTSSLALRPWRLDTVLPRASAYSAKAPQGPTGASTQQVSRRPVFTHTASPTARFEMPSPTFTTVPATSKPGTYGKVTGQMPCIPPLMTFQSMGFTAASSTLIKTWPAEGDGTGTVSSVILLMVSAGFPSAP